MSFTLGEIASEIGAELRGDPAIEIKGPATLETAESGDITYITSRKFSRQLETTGASAVIAYPGLERARIVPFWWRKILIWPLPLS